MVLTICRSAIADEAAEDISASAFEKIEYVRSGGFAGVFEPVDTRLT
jgi:protein-tyrosine-phosphatase